MVDDLIGGVTHEEPVVVPFIWVELNLPKHFTNVGGDGDLVTSEGGQDGRE